MTAISLQLRLLPSPLAICRLAPSAPGAAPPSPSWCTAGAFFSITRTPAELSIVCDAAVVPPGIPTVGPWRALEVAGPLDFALTGILARIAQPLADAGISIFAVSTYDTDYVLVKEESAANAVDALRRSGISVE